MSANEGAMIASKPQSSRPQSSRPRDDHEPGVKPRAVLNLHRCIGCGLCVTLGNTTAPQPRDFGCPPDYDAINMHDWDEVVDVLEASTDDQAEPATETTT